MSKIIATNTLTHWCVMRMVVMTWTIRADWIMVVIPIAMIPINKRIYTIIWTPPTWPIAPIIWRMPAYPRWTPKPVINHWTIDIYGLNNVV